MDNTNQPVTSDTLNQQRTDAYNAANTATDLSTDAPSLLNTLKQNLVGIFSDNNPIVTARNNALSDYLSEGANTRASLLSSNLGDVPGVSGRTMTLSPTEQDAIVTSRNAAAYAPLNGYNAILQAMFGTIPDMVKNAGDIYNATISGANAKASNLENLYKDSLAQYDAQQKAASSGSLLGDPTIAALVQAILNGSNNNNNNQNSNIPSLDDIFGFSAQNSQNTIPKIGGGQIPVPSNVKIQSPKKSSPNNLSIGGSFNPLAGLGLNTGTGF